MITCSRLGEMGRFGNQLWQIASGIGIAARNLDNFALVKDWEYQNNFKHKLPIASPSYLHKIIEKEPYYTEYNLSRDINWDLFGYFQSWKYFKDCQSTIHYYFEFDNEWTPFQKVAVHVRRGDYLSLEFVHPNLSKTDYYNNAIDYFKTKYNHCGFHFFSDDIEWCKDNLYRDDSIYYSTGNEIDDFKLMSSYSNFIIANSSYSWWAAWLSKSENVVAPKTWVIGENRDDRVPPEWIRL